MTASRRAALKTGAAFCLLNLLAAFGLVSPGDAWAQAWERGAFDKKKLIDALRALGDAAPIASDQILITAPDTAENGAIVSVAAVSKIPGTQRIAWLIERNPSTLAAIFDFPSGTLPEIGTRVKIAETSNVIVLVKAGERFYSAQKRIHVTVGGCA